MQTEALQSTYDRGIIRDVPRHMLPPGSVWSMFDFIPNINGEPLRKRGGWQGGPALASATNLNAVAYTPINGSDNYCAVDNFGALWQSPVDYKKSVLLASPSLYWRFGEVAGSTIAQDASGHGKTGLYHGVTLKQDGLVPGDADTAGAFLNSDQSRVSAAAYRPFVAGSSRTFMGLANRTSANNTDILFGSDADGVAAYLAINSFTNDVSFAPTAGASVTWTAAWPGVGVDVHWTLTYNDSTRIAELFINGVSKGTRLCGGVYGSATNNSTFQAGFSSLWVESLGIYSFNGVLDEIAVFESILAAGTISGIYNSLSSGSSWTNKGAACTTRQRPIFFNNELIILPDGVFFFFPKKYDGGTVSVLSTADLPGVTPIWGVAYKSRLVLADDTTLYFSDPLDPESYDVDSFVKVTDSITGLAALPNMIAIFSPGHCERLRGSTPPSTTTDGDMTLEPAFAEGCIDARSIVVFRDRMIWANLNGVHISDGAGIENLVESGGLRDYWHSIMQSYTSGWTFAGGIFKGHYVLSITDASGAHVAAMVCDLSKKTWLFFNNLPVRMFSESYGATAELLMALRTHGYVGYFSPCFEPDSGSDSDADGTPVQPSLEFPIFRGGTGSSRWLELFLGVDFQSEAGHLAVSYTTTPEGGDYNIPTGDTDPPIPAIITPTNGYARVRVPIRAAANALGIKVEQVGAATKTSLFDLEARVRVREGRY